MNLLHALCLLAWARAFSPVLLGFMFSRFLQAMEILSFLLFLKTPPETFLYFSNKGKNK